MEQRMGICGVALSWPIEMEMVRMITDTIKKASKKEGLTFALIENI